jgi:UDP-hydrolysing UDP-N-acetyl-D-glucosamine 2-epimerase
MIPRLWLVSAGRSDYGLYRPLLRALAADARFAWGVVATGMHLRAEHGHTVEEIERDGFPIVHRVPMLEASDTPESIGDSIGRGVSGFARIFATERPDLLIVLGDRFDMLPAPVAASCFGLPVAHLHGGEVTVGAIDDAYRHAITKLSHLHFTSTEPYRRRVIQLGEAPDRVHCVGALSMDAIRALQPQREAGEPETDEEGFLLVTLHPATLEGPGTAERDVTELMAALELVEFPILCTQANADPGGAVINDALRAFAARRPRVRLVPSLGSDGYLRAMSRARAMVGNSSSGIVEAGAFRLPVVNIGSRQEGRVRGQNVIDVAASRAAILEGIRIATSSDFRETLIRMENPYGDGTAAARIVEILAGIDDFRGLLRKRFFDVPVMMSPDIALAAG